jgi:phosphatidate cytidylyltransferase
MRAGPLRNELALRVASAALLVPLAIGAAWLGGWPFAAFWGAAALIVLWEWNGLVAGADRRTVLVAGAAAVAFAAVLASAGQLTAAVAVLGIGALAAAALGPAARRVWAAAGVPYAGAIAAAPIVLRGSDGDGFLAILFVFAVVWATDIAAYFTGRAIGGPRLMPSVSPGKTWSGAIGGTLAAVLAAVALAAAVKLGAGLAIVLVAATLSVLAQAGDLFESFVKRRFGAKDAGHLIPGHGGLMDRLDGFVAAGTAAALIGLARGGFEAPGRGLLSW